MPWKAEHARAFGACVIRFNKKYTQKLGVTPSNSDLAETWGPQGVSGGET